MAADTADRLVVELARALASCGPTAPFFDSVRSHLVALVGAAGGHWYSWRGERGIFPSDLDLIELPDDSRARWRELTAPGGSPLVSAASGPEVALVLEARRARTALLAPIDNGEGCPGFLALYDPRRNPPGATGLAAAVAGAALGERRPSPDGLFWGEQVAIVRAFTHDMRNHLSVVLNQAELLVEELESDGFDPAAGIESLRDIVQAANAAREQVAALAEHFPREQAGS